MKQLLKLAKALAAASARLDKLESQSPEKIRAGIETELQKLAAADALLRSAIASEQESSRKQFSAAQTQQQEAIRAEIRELSQRLESAARNGDAELSRAIGADIGQVRGALENLKNRVELAISAGFTLRGEWSPDETYSVNDVVVLNGSSFASRINGNKARPNKRGTSGWQLLAAAGAGGGGGDGGGIPTTRAINTTAPLAGGGTLASNLTLSIGAATTSSAGTVPGIGGTTLTNAATVGQLRGPARSRMVELFTDFYGSTSGGTDGLTFVSDSSGAGSGLSFPTSDLAAGECGVVSISTGTTTTGRGLINTANTSQLPRLDGGATVFEAKVRIPILSDGTDTFTAFVGGRGSGTNADTGGNDANGFRYTHSTNGGRWLAVSRSGASESSADTGVAPTANTWQVLRIEINATGTSAAYFIDGVLVATITTNIQVLGRGRLQHGLLKSAGTNARTVELDYVYFLKEFSAAR